MPEESETDSLDDFLEFIRCLFYGPKEKSKKVEKRKEKLPKLNPKNKDDKPRANDDDLLGVLKVQEKPPGIDLKIQENTELHHTDKYYCTKDEDEVGNALEPELVVRRGQTFKIAVTFDRPYNVEKDDLIFEFKTGTLGDARKETHGRFKLQETGKPKYRHDKWGGYLVKQDGNTIITEVYIPATCAIGEWSFCVTTKTKGQKKSIAYEHPEDFYILFNPWCKDDATYIGDVEGGTEEYVLNDTGLVYRGSAWFPRPKEWNFGQFEEGILEAALLVIMKCFNAKTQFRLSDPVTVARVIAQVVNCCDEDNGILWGNWSGNYEDGTSPLDWYGSPRIIRKYMETGKPVKYGQCWVFSGVTTTICRAIGLPARSVTNFGSAHDTDWSCTIDKYFVRDEAGILIPDKDSNNDSIWNYHVWNDVYMTRPDIKAIKGDTCDYDGWQAIDATPQERSKGVFTCGPCPLNAIKNGEVTIDYDCDFIFSEVNADEIHWEVLPDGSCIKIDMKAEKVGKSISTKAVGDSGIFGSPREDVTGIYKFAEGTEDSRKAVLRAACGAKRPKDAYGGGGEKDDVEFKLMHEANVNLGEDMDIKLTAVNKSEYKRELSGVVFRVFPKNYNGHCSMQAIKIHEIKEDTELVPNKEYEFKCTLKSTEYLPKIDSGRNMNIQAFALVKKTRSRNMQNCVKEHDIELGAPTLNIEMPATAKRGEEFVATVTFTNPLLDELTCCTAGYEGNGFKAVTGQPQSNVPAAGKFEKKFTLKTKQKGDFTLTFKFNSKELHFLSGSGKVKVEA
ncbi:annulin-like [Mercenaria mercenaria]|uniref:annulin-like n=1 Tax=Mercenaria mercenaria TaxID=6596 RepID=UPI00234E8A49|nr:annulin-like [Mercenaria mercenaria]XP_053402044.1 annulin-like [Mercenaria mercenaria]